jgi:hypothetical protein
MTRLNLTPFLLFFLLVNYNCKLIVCKHRMTVTWFIICAGGEFINELKSWPGAIDGAGRCHSEHSEESLSNTEVTC